MKRFLAGAYVFVCLGSFGQSCPTIPPNGRGFKPGTTVQVYIDTSAVSVAATEPGIASGITAWNGVNGITYNIHLGTQGYVASADVNSPTWLVQVGTVTPGKDATTGGINGQVPNMTTTLRDSYLQSWANDDSADGPEELMAHETTHANWNGDCQATSTASCTGVASNADGNTNPGPQQCDKAATISNTNQAASIVGSGGSGPEVCGTTPPSCDGSYVAECDTTGWQCIPAADCGGDSPCDGATCSEGLWDTSSCGTVSVAQCDGTAPCDGAVCAGDNSWDTSGCTTVTTAQCDGAPPCDTAVCTADNTWDSSSCNTGCTDVCDASCSNYDPCACDPASCGGDGGGGGGGGCPGSCDPGDCGYDPGACSPGCGGDAISPTQLLKTEIKLHPLCD